VVSPAVFLDRDGVINANLERNGKPVAPTTLEDFRLLPGVEMAASELKQAAYLVIVCTNRPDVAAGRAPSRQSTRRSARNWPSTTSKSVSTPMPMRAHAASRSQA